MSPLTNRKLTLADLSSRQYDQLKQLHSAAEKLVELAGELTTSIDGNLGQVVLRLGSGERRAQFELRQTRYGGLKLAWDSWFDTSGVTILMGSMCLVRAGFPPVIAEILDWVRETEAPPQVDYSRPRADPTPNALLPCRRLGCQTPHRPRTENQGINTVGKRGETCPGEQCLPGLLEPK